MSKQNPLTNAYPAPSNCLWAVTTLLTSCQWAGPLACQAPPTGAGALMTFHLKIILRLVSYAIFHVYLDVILRNIEEFLAL